MCSAVAKGVVLSSTPNCYARPVMLRLRPTKLTLMTVSQMSSSKMPALLITVSILPNRLLVSSNAETYRFRKINSSGHTCRIVLLQCSLLVSHKIRIRPFTSWAQFLTDQVKNMGIIITAQITVNRLHSDIRRTNTVFFLIKAALL